MTVTIFDGVNDSSLYQDHGCDLLSVFVGEPVLSLLTAATYPRGRCVCAESKMLLLAQRFCLCKCMPL